MTLFIVDGEILASCGHVAHRTSPPLGGASVMRESIPIPQDIYASAVRLATAIGMQGVCEVEFRRDADDRPLLMEINARLAGTIENAVHSGVDFPLMIWQWATGLPVDRSTATGPGSGPAGCTAICGGCGTTSGGSGGRTACLGPGRSGSSPRNSPGPTITTASTGDDLGPVMAELRTTAAAVRKSRSRQPPSANGLGRERYVSTTRCSSSVPGPSGCRSPRTFARLGRRPSHRGPPDGHLARAHADRHEAEIRALRLGHRGA